MRSLGTLSGILLVTACAEPERPVFPLPNADQEDTIAPLIFFAAPSDSVFSVGDPLMVSLQVFDRSGIAVVTAAVSGIMNFGFANVTPHDTIFEAQYPVPTAGAPPGILNFSVTAIDSVGNQAAVMRRFTLQ